MEQRMETVEQLVSFHHIQVQLQGGAPWGFTLKGGLEHGEPLIITKIEDGGKAAQCKKLRVGDELVNINGSVLYGSRQEALILIKGSYRILKMVVRRRSVPVIRPHSWHLAKLSEPSSTAAPDAPPAMQLHPVPFSVPWHSGGDNSDLSMQWSQLSRHCSTDRSSSLGSMESLDPPSQGYYESQLSPVDPAIFNNKRDSAYSSFSASSNTSDYTVASSMDNLLHGLSRCAQPAAEPGDFAEEPAAKSHSLAAPRGAGPAVVLRLRRSGRAAGPRSPRAQGQLQGHARPPRSRRQALRLRPVDILSLAGCRGGAGREGVSLRAAGTRPAGGAGWTTPLLPKTRRAGGAPSPPRQPPPPEGKPAAGGHRHSAPEKLLSEELRLLGLPNGRAESGPWPKSAPPPAEAPGSPGGRGRAGEVGREQVLHPRLGGYLRGGGARGGDGGRPRAHLRPVPRPSLLGPLGQRARDAPGGSPPPGSAPTPRPRRSAGSARRPARTRCWRRGGGAPPQTRLLPPAALLQARRRSERFATNLRNEIQRKKAQLQRSAGGPETVQEEEAAEPAPKPRSASPLSPPSPPSPPKPAVTDPCPQTLPPALSTGWSPTPRPSCTRRRTCMMRWTPRGAFGARVGAGARPRTSRAPRQSGRWRWTPQHKLQPEAEQEKRGARAGAGGAATLGHPVRPAASAPPLPPGRVRHTPFRRPPEVLRGDQQEHVRVQPPRPDEPTPEAGGVRATTRPRPHGNARPEPGAGGTPARASLSRQSPPAARRSPGGRARGQCSYERRDGHAPRSAFHPVAPATVSASQENPRSRLGHEQRSRTPTAYPVREREQTKLNRKFSLTERDYTWCRRDLQAAEGAVQQGCRSGDSRGSERLSACSAEEPQAARYPQRGRALSESDIRLDSQRLCTRSAALPPREEPESREARSPAFVRRAFRPVAPPLNECELPLQRPAPPTLPSEPYTIPADPEAAAPDRPAVPKPAPPAKRAAASGRRRNPRRQPARLGGPRGGRRLPQGALRRSLTSPSATSSSSRSSRKQVRTRGAEPEQRTPAWPPTGVRDGHRRVPGRGGGGARGDGDAVLRPAGDGPGDGHRHPPRGGGPARVRDQDPRGSLVEALLVEDSGSRTRADLMEELFPHSAEGEASGETWRGGHSALELSVNTLERRSRQGSSRTQGQGSYCTSAATKAELLNKMKELPRMNVRDDDEELCYKRQLMESLRKKLGVLREAQRGLQDDMRANAQLGEEVEALVLAVCKPNEVDKFRMFIGDLDKVVSLLLSLSGRLLRVESALECLGNDSAHHERLPLLEKKKLLQGQLGEAQELKEHVDRREQAVCRVLGRCLTPEQLRDYSHYVKMKAALLVEQRQLEDKIRLGEEQLRALRESLGLGMGVPVGLGYGHY
ncbi:hypothetical protein ANANG_G00059220 [Anguilla anguilla]|uniref:Shroom family member 4 n=1 Tax=Anguilla anguilla TaxID=7936 RepID=A0A9D3S1T2_ANGAN|nr:hypothetical protein ANANG_G00059220 [Anguilla anguilla]